MTPAPILPHDDDARMLGLCRAYVDALRGQFAAAAAMRACTGPLDEIEAMARVLVQKQTATAQALAALTDAAMVAARRMK